MAKNIFVASLSYSTTVEELSAHFKTCGTVVHAKILTDRETGKSRGIGFVEMSTDEEAKLAIGKLSGSELGGRRIFASEAKPQEKRPPGGSFNKDRRPGGGRPGGRPGEPKRQFWKPDDAGPRDDSQKDGKRKWGAKEGFYDKKKPWTRQPEGRFGKKGGGFDDDWGGKKKGGFKKKGRFGPKKGPRKSDY